MVTMVTMVKTLRHVIENIAFFYEFLLQITYLKCMTVYGV